MPILREEYNTLLKRWKDAFVFLNTDISQEEKERWLPEYEKICERLNKLTTLLRLNDAKITNEQLMKGFG